MSDLAYDVIVVGSGAAGSIAVKELTERGLKTLLLEAGPYMDEKDFLVTAGDSGGKKRIDAWERIRIGMHGQPIQARATFMSDKIRHLFVNDFQNPYTTPHDKFFLWVRGRQLGGRLHSYGRVLQRMSDFDFKASSFDGKGTDWPIGYADLQPYYDKIERFLGLYGNADNLPNVPDGQYRQSPRILKVEQDFKSFVESHYPGRRVVSWRFAAPNLMRIPQGIVAARDTGLLDIRTDAIVETILTDPASGRATGVSFIDRNTKKVHRVYADAIHLCASAIESVRILLNSACSKHPDGIGNSTGMLGRYFVDQTPSTIFGRVPGVKGYESDNSVPQDPWTRAAGGILIPRYENVGRQTNSKFSRGFAYQGVIGRLTVPDNEDAMFGMMGFGEMIARPENRITLNRRKRDSWGIPVANIDVSLAENDTAILQEQVRSIHEMVTNAGYKIDFEGSALGLERPSEAMKNEGFISRLIFRASFKKSLALGAAIHESGGARMGTDPSNSVLNEFNQCWDAPNIYISDGACFVSSGTVGPTLTIMALSARTAANIVHNQSRGVV